MINLFEKFDTDSLDFLRSQRIAGINIPTVVVYDDGFLPDDVDSPIKYYCNFKKEGKPLYFDKLPLPRFWRITATAQKGEVYDLDKKKAEIHFVKADNNRLIREVDWLDNQGQVRWTDHYNSKGTRYAQTYFNKEQTVLKKYFNDQGKNVITVLPASGDIFLNYQGRHKHFEKLNDFLEDYLNERNYQLDHIFYNTLNIPFFLSLNLRQPGVDTLFWHEAVNSEVPGNMQYLMNIKTRTKHILVQRYREWQDKRKLFTKTANVDFGYLGMIYPHPRGNQLRSNALILTNSDQIENLTELVTAMPKIHFNIAAVTEMSDKLMAFDQYQNVSLYPSAANDTIQKLMKECDLYFDINYGNEILDAVRGAFEQNMLIVGFEDTIHNKQFISDKNVFSSRDILGMKQKVMDSLDNVRVMKNEIDYQKKQAGDVTVADYQKQIGALRNERIRQ